MRCQGRITEWKDDRGFGFITPNGGGARVFIHFRALRGGEPRPVGNELVTYELESTGNAKGPRATDVMYVDRSRVVAPGRERASRRPRRSDRQYGASFGVVLLFGLLVFGWAKYVDRRDAIPLSTPITPSRSSTPASSNLTEQVAPAAFRCEGKKYCSQMTSCAEAKYYLQHCSVVEIDGNHDGIPCEKQWCK